MERPKLKLVRSKEMVGNPTSPEKLEKSPVPEHEDIGPLTMEDSQEPLRMEEGEGSERDASIRRNVNADYMHWQAMVDDESVDKALAPQEDRPETQAAVRPEAPRAEVSQASVVTPDTTTPHIPDTVATTPDAAPQPGDVLVEIPGTGPGTPATTPQSERHGISRAVSSAPYTPTMHYPQGHGASQGLPQTEQYRPRIHYPLRHGVSRAIPETQPQNRGAEQAPRAPERREMTDRVQLELLGLIAGVDRTIVLDRTGRERVLNPSLEHEMQRFLSMRDAFTDAEAEAAQLDKEYRHRRAHQGESGIDEVFLARRAAARGRANELVGAYNIAVRSLTSEVVTAVTASPEGRDETERTRRKRRAQERIFLNTMRVLDRGLTTARKEARAAVKRRRRQGNIRS